ncbi:MAG: glycosyltransferase [Desulfobacteraceae bacterium]|nr:glycosyltransferase [Desulfobacteraceae bacterium]MBC2751033.1 glycosyltransferase [Desulfobacteraceae bacterium]
MRVDLHVHSKYSKRPSAWVLKKIGCPESFTEPQDIYRIALARGMTHVTISDHNRIEGALAIAHLPHTFISEEITTYFPEDRCKLHVLALDITERQHADIQQCRDNVFYLVDYLRAQGIVHVVAHPLYGVNDRLSIEHFEKMLLLFKNFEMNGARNDVANEGLEAVLKALSPDMIEALSDRHGIDPAFPEPWEKNITGGSDDHSSLNIARTFTEIPGAGNLKDGLAGLENGQSRAVRQPSLPETMAHNFYSIAYQYYRSKFNLERFQGKDLLIKYLDRSLRPNGCDGKGHDGRLIDKVYCFLNAHRRTRPEPVSDDLIGLLRHTTASLLKDDRQFKRLALTGAQNDLPPEIGWFDFVNQVSNQALINFANHAMNHLLGGNVFNIFHTLGSAGGLYGLLAPYFIAFSLFSKDRDFTHAVRDHFGVPSPANAGTADTLRVGHFTDTFYDTNGVALTLQQQVQVALRHGKSLQVITCNEDPHLSQPGVKAFQPIGTYDLPEYPEQKLFYPPLMEMLRYCYEQGFTRIHSATPGPIGLAALAIARILKLPICGTYHTQLPQYAQFLTGDDAMAELTWKFVVWYYDQMDLIYAPSEDTRQELIARGINGDKIALYPRGIDTERFSPEKRNGFFEQSYGVAASTKLLYVGRISKEKNLAVLGDAFRLLYARQAQAHLVIVGDGPYLNEMKALLSDLPCTFTGALAGDDLAKAYASADIFVFPSTTDTFGNVVLEAQASGLPVVVSDQGGPCENMLPDTTGRVVPGNDVEALAAALNDILSNPRQRRAMGRAARRSMEERSFDAAFLKTWESYQTISAGERFQWVAGF